MDNIEQIRTAVFSVYDLQKLRIQMGNRLAMNFRAKLGGPALEKEDDAEALKIIDELKASWKRLTDGVARNRTLPDRRGFKGDHLISDYAELALVDSYIQIERQEDRAFKIIENLLDGIPIWDTWLKGLRGVGPATAGVLVAYFDPRKAPNVSKFWSYAGLDVASDGRARGRFKEHLIERTFTNKDGKESTRLSVTYNPWLKSRLLGAVGPTFMKSNSPYRADYDRYRHSIETDPARLKMTEPQRKKHLEAIDNPEGKLAEGRRIWTPGRIHRASMRYMLKRFLADFWQQWRTLEGLPVGPDYNEARRGRLHGQAAE